MEGFRGGVSKIGADTIYPDEEGRLTLTQPQFIASQREAITEIETVPLESRKNEVFEKGLAGEIDLNSIFGDGNKIFEDDDQYEQVKAAAKRVNAGAGSPEDVSLLEAIRDPDSDARVYFDYYANTSEGSRIASGVISTGTFPLDSTTGKVIIPEDVTLENPYRNTEAALQQKAEDSLSIKNWMQDRADAPVNTDVRNALFEAFGTTGWDAFSERIYNLGASTVELGFWASLGAQWISSFGENEMFSWPEDLDSKEERLVALQKFRASGDWLNSRQEVIDEMVRNQLKFDLGEEEYVKRGYDRKVKLEDGTEVYEIKLVSDSFAEALSEELFDMKGWRTRFSTLIFENAAAYNAVTKPAKYVNEQARKARRAIDAWNPYSGTTTPFNLMTPQERLIAVNRRARTKGIPAPLAAQQLSQESMDGRWFSGFRSRVLQRGLNRQISAAELAAATESSEKSIALMQGELRSLRASRTTTPKDRARINQLNRDIDLEIQRQNWRMVQSASLEAQEYGISPAFDVVIALSQVGGREMMGPLGELVGPVTLISAVGVKNLFGLDRLAGRLPGAGLATQGSYAVKRGAEKTINLFFEIQKFVTGTQIGSGGGLLVNPNIRAYLRMSSKERANLPASVNASILGFQEGLRYLNPEVQDMIINNMQQSFDDIAQMVSLIPKNLSYVNETGATVLYRDELQRALALNFGEMSGLNFFIAASKAQSLNNATPSSVLRVDQVVRNSLEGQEAMTRKMASLSAAYEILNQNILRLRETVNDPTLPVDMQASAKEALNRLEGFATMFENERSMSQLEFDNMLIRDAEIAAKQLDILANPLNGDISNEAIQSGAVESLIEIIRRAEKRVLDADSNPTIATVKVVDNETGEVISQPVNPYGQKEVTAEKLQETAISADQAVQNLKSAVLAAGKATNITKTAAETLDQQDALISGLSKTIQAQHDIVVKNAYDLVSDKDSIPLNVFASGMLDAFQAFRLNETESIAKLANPTRLESLGGATGRKMYVGLQRGASKGLRELFSSPQALEALSRGYGREFADAESVIDFLKFEYYGTNDAAMAAMGLDARLGGDAITDLHLALYLIDDANTPFNARNLNFLVSPKELEEFRQGMGILANSTVESKQGIGRVAMQQIDTLFNEWANTLNVNDYNLVVRARSLSRLSKQAFDKNTLGYDIDRVTAASRAAIIGEGEITEIGTKNPSTFLDPIVDAIINPTSQSSSIVQREMKRLSTTFAPLVDTFPENVLVAGADGKFRRPTDDQLSRMVTSTMSEETFDIISTLVNAKIRENSVKSRGLQSVADMATNNQIPRIDINELPKQMDIPARYNGNLNDYLAEMQSKTTVTVMIDGKPVSKSLFDPDSMLVADITEVVNSSQTMQRAHFALLEEAKTFAADLGPLQKAAQQKQADIIRAAQNSEMSTTGEAFFTKQIQSGNANSVTKYINTVNDPAFKARVGATDEEIQGALQAVFDQTLRHVSGDSMTGDSVKMFDGVNVPVNSMQTPQNAFQLISEALDGSTQQGKNLKKLADAAGVSEDQLRTLKAIYRYGTIIQGSRLVPQTAGGVTAGTKGFTLDNALSKAFNIARGMVSKEYVAAEIALRYAALGKGKMLTLVMNDPKVSDIMYNLLTDVEAVKESDALFLSKQIMKSLAGDQYFTDYMQSQVDVDDYQYAKQYWENIGVYDVSDEITGE